MAIREVPEEVASKEVIPNEMPPGARLFMQRAHWAFSPWASRIIAKGLFWKWKDQPPLLRRFFQSKTPLLTEYVEDLLSRGVVQEVKSVRFQARMFFVSKKDTNKKRAILDLSPLNVHIQCDNFQMLTISQVRTLLPRSGYTISIDLTDAYWHIPIARRFTRYLGFRVEHKAYTFKVLPFGLNIAPASSRR